MGVAGGVNLYDYNGNDPNSFSDPFGLESGDCPDCPRQIVHPVEGGITPLPLSKDPILAGLIGAADATLMAARAGETAVGEAVESMFGSSTVDRIAAAGKDVTRSGSVMNRVATMSGDAFKAALRGEGFGEEQLKSGVARFTKDATRVTTYTSKSTGGPSADVLLNGTRKLKIRFGPE
jgi:hypothetical protein